MRTNKSSVRRWLKIGAIAGAGLLLLAVAGLFALYRATQHVPEFYRKAIQADPATLAAASDQMLRRATALASDVKKPGRWQALFTADEINGWLAVDLVKNHGASLPPAIRDPRVHIEPDRLTLACRFRQGGLESVLSLIVEVHLAESNRIALRIRKVRAGALPLPLGDVLGELSEAARRAEYPIEWRQSGGDPVALIPVQAVDQRAAVRIEKLVIRQGEIYLEGTTTSR